jgi:hypothetical protein
MWRESTMDAGQVNAIGLTGNPGAPHQLVVRHAPLDSEAVILRSFRISLKERSRLIVFNTSITDDCVEGNYAIVPR